MSEYTYNDDKPSKLLTGYSTVRGAELKSIYTFVGGGQDVTETDIEERFGRPDFASGNTNTVHIDSCLRFLEAIDMIEISDTDVVSLTNDEFYPELESFEPRLLAHIRKQEGEQYHLSYLFDITAKQDTRRCSLEELLEVAKGDETNLFDLAWREEKLRMWANLADHVGALSYLSGDGENEVMTSPARPLLGELLSWYNENGEDSKRFARAMEWIDSEFLGVFSESLNIPTVSVGVADVLANMVDDGVLTLRSMSDTEDVVELPMPNGGTRRISTFNIERPFPQKPTYWYPIDRNERRMNP